VLGEEVGLEFEETFIGVLLLLFVVGGVGVVFFCRNGVPFTVRGLVEYVTLPITFFECVQYTSSIGLKRR